MNKYKGVSVKLKKFFGALGSTDVIDFFNRSSQFLTDKELAQFTPHHINRFTNQDIKIEPARLLTLLGMIDIKTYLEGDILCKVDRATMQVALEGREPFLDHHIIEFSQRIPDSLKIHKKESKSDIPHKKI